MNSYLPAITIIILNYNGKAYLRGCFESLTKLVYPKDKYNVIMVDNGSKDGSVDYVKKTFPWVCSSSLIFSSGESHLDNVSELYGHMPMIGIAKTLPNVFSNSINSSIKSFWKKQELSPKILQPLNPFSVASSCSCLTISRVVAMLNFPSIT